MSKSNLIVCAKPVSVSSQYEDYDFNKMSFMGSGEFTGIYYNDTAPNGQARGNNLGCKGVYVIGVYSATTGANSILNKEVTLYLSDKQLSELQSGTSLLKQCANKTTTFDNSYYIDKANLIAHLKTAFSTVTDAIKFSYTSKSHYTDSLQFISFDETYCSATFTWTNKIMHIFNKIFANVPGSYDTEKNTLYSLRTYDTALYTYDMLDFGLVEIYPTCFAVGTTNTVAGDGAIVTGVGSKAMGAFSAAFGRSAEARGYSTFAAGHQSKALIEKSVALGDSCETRGTGSFAAGYQCIANGEYSVAMGDRSNANATRSFTIGRKNNTNKDYSVAIGDECTTNAKNSISLGTQNNTKGNYSVALGANIITSSLTSTTNKTNQVIVGSYNYENTSARFAVGGGEEVNTNVVGSDSNKTKYTEIIRKNIFEITSDGKIIVPLYKPNGTEPITDDDGNPKCGYIFLCKDSSGVSLRCAEINSENKRYKKVWRNNSTGVETTTDPTL